MEPLGPGEDLRRLLEPDPELDAFRVSREAALRRRLRDAETIPTDAYNQARLTGDPSASPRAQAQDPELYTMSPIEVGEQTLRQRPVFMEYAEKEPGLIEALGIDKLPSAGEVWDAVATTAPAVGGASKDELKKGVLQVENGFRGFLGVSDDLFGTTLGGARNDAAIERNMEQMALLVERTQTVPRGLQFIPKGVGQLPNTAGALGARATGVGLGIGATALAGPAVGAPVGVGATYALPMAFTGMIEGGNWRNEYLREHPDDDRRLVAAAAIGVGIINGALELIPLERAVSTIAGQARREMTKLMADRAFREVLLHGLQRWAIQIGSEGITEAAQAIAPLVADQVGDWANGRITMEEMWSNIFSVESLERMAVEGLEGLEAAILTGGLETAAGVVSSSYGVQSARAARARFEQIAKAAADNAALIESAPDKFTKLVDEAAAEGGNLEDVYITPDALRKAYGDTATALADLFEKIPGLQERLEVAESTNGKVRVSTGEFATYMAGGEQFTSLADHISFGEGLPSLAESREMGQATDALEGLVKRMEAYRGSAELDPVVARENEADFVAYLDAAFTESMPAVTAQVRNRTAKLFARMISRVAEMDGQDPLELFTTITDRLTMEQRPTLDTEGEQARSDAFGTERFRQPVQQDRIATMPRAELQSEAKKLGVKANGKTEEIRARVAEQFTSRGEAGATRGQLVVDRRLQRFLLQIAETDVDDSTLVHEVAHLALELVLDVSEGAQASDEIRGYAGDVLQFLGVKSRDQITQRHHERWAESWELYLREGKAPTTELQGLFSYFRARLIAIYQTLRGRLLEADRDLTFVPLFDRLLATDQEIRAAKSRLDVVSGFASASALADLTQAEQNEVIARLREVQAAERAREEKLIARELDRVHKAQRGALRERFREEVYARTEQRLRYWLIRGVLPDGEPLETLSTDKLAASDIEAIGGDPKRLPRGTWTRSGGVDPATVAAAFGYESPEEMLDALEAAENPERLISRLVHEEAERQGLVATSEELQALAAEALDDTKRDRLYDLERRIARRLQAQEAVRGAEERATAGEAATSAQDAKARIQAAQEALDEAISRQADQSELDLLQIELQRARAGSTVAKAARSDQAVANRLARDLPRRVSRQMYRDAAKRVVDKIEVRHLKREVAGWVTRRARSARDKVSASVARDWAGYEAAVESERLANALVDVGSEALRESAKQRRYFIDFRKPGSRKRQRLGKHAIDVDLAGNETRYLDVIDALLGSVNFSPISSKRIDQATQVEAFAAKLAAERGITIPLPPWVTELQKRPSYKSMTTEQLGDLYRAVRALEVNGLRMAMDAESLEASQEQALVDAVRTQLATRTPSVARLANNFETLEGDKRKRDAMRFFASLISFERKADYIDELNPMGPMNMAFVKDLQEGAEVERLGFKKMDSRIVPVWERYTPTERRQFRTHKILIRSLGPNGQYMTKNGIMAIAAQMGTEHGENALRDSAAYGLTDSQLSEILSHITDKDADILIDMSKAISPLYDEYAAAQRRMNGEAAPRVPVRPWRLPSGREMPGFYWPIRFNTELSARAHDLDERRIAQDMFGFHAGQVTRTAGAMHARARTSGKLTIDADYIGTLTSHINDMVKGIAWQERMIMLERRRRMLASDLEASIGTALARTIRPYFVRLAGTDRQSRNTSWLNRWAGEARGGLSMVAMGYKATTAAINLSGFLPAMHKVGVANTLRGFTDIWLSGHPIQTLDFLQEHIPSLRDRINRWDRDAQEKMLLLNPIDIRHPIRSRESVRAVMAHYGFMAIGYVDAFVSSAVAAGAMRQALNGEVDGVEFGNLEQAAWWAGKVVRETQGSGDKVDLPAIMDGDNMQKMLTTMMTYTNTQLQEAVLQGALQYEQAAEAKRAKREGRQPLHVPHNKPRFFAFVLFTYLLAPIMEELIRLGIKQTEPEPPEFDEWFANLALKISFGPLSGIPVVRELESFLRGFAAGETPFTTTIETYGKVVKETAKLPTDEFDHEKMLRAWAQFGTYSTSIPTMQMVNAAEVVMQQPFGRGNR